MNIFKPNLSQLKKSLIKKKLVKIPIPLPISNNYVFGQLHNKIYNDNF